MANHLSLLENPKVHSSLKSRVRRVQERLDLGQRIIEIAPNWAPLVSKQDMDFSSKNAKLVYTDRISTQQLLEREKNNPSRTEQGCEVVPVDFVWTPGRELVEATKGERFDYAISSHVIEHIPDFLGHFIEVWNVLNNDGSYVFVLPNPLGTGEFFRRPSVLSDVVNSFFQDKDATSPGQNWEYLTKAFHWTGEKMEGKSLVDFKRHHTEAEAIQDAVRCQREYVDVHCWCFSPENFKTTWEELTSFNLNPFDLIEVLESEEKSLEGHCGEYICVLKRNNDFNLPDAWRQLLEEKKERGRAKPTVGILTSALEAVKRSRYRKVAAPLRWVKSKVSA